jgi:hypothetical protein
MKYFKIILKFIEVVMKYTIKEIRKTLFIPLKTCIIRIVKKRDDDDPFNHPFAIL